MKKLFVLAAVFVSLLPTVSFADTPDEIMKTAVQLYQNADYDLAA